ncbi:WD repeat-containing protein 93-like isoform X2 [Babylonia areolata]|uniref:WD repeat-containing protein 93-like isoform X2 n=1 Tax=Babylonia areolata TaxID=304850 RepID=UPI003FD2590B
MPVYIRKNLSFTPTSLERMSDEEDDDYLQDPDQMRDSLPQPYRMIDKVLNKLLEDAWDIIEMKENKRLADERKIRPPKYDKPNDLPFLSQATALASSTDGKYLFAGLPNGLVAMDALTQQTLNQWEEDGAEITSIQTYAFSATASLLVTIDDMAVARLFLFACDCLFFVKVLNETADGGTKLLTSRCEASLEGDYVGIVLENTSTKEVWFEAHKVPREAWVSELEAVEEKFQKQKEKEQKEKEGKGEQPSTEESVDQSAEDLQKSQELKGESPRGSTPPPPTNVDTSAYKFSAPALVLKVKPPVSYAANSSSSTFSACQKVDATGAVLGTGQTHIMSPSHLESRDTTFQHTHASLFKDATREDGEDKDKGDQDIMMATFHFLNPGRILLTGCEPIGQTDRPSCVALWWKGSNHFLQFSLLKVGKEMEHKPDVVWPFSSPITSSAISTCTSHLAIGLDNGNVTIWDRYIGLQRGVVNMNPKSGVQMLRFLDPSLYPSASMEYPPYPQRTATFLLAQYKDSSQFIYDVGKVTQDQPMCIGEKPDFDDEVQTLLESVPDLPELCLMVQKDGTLYLKDIQTGVRVCQLAFQKPFQLVSPWEPIVSFGGRGQLLFVKGSGTVSEEESEETTETSEVFIHTLRSYPTLDPYWNKTRTPAQLQVHPTIETRLDALMKERVAQQALRKQRLQMRWGMLRSDLAVIQNAKEVNVTTTDSRPFQI